MTDVTSNDNARQKGGFAKSKKFSARIDMTPMVDLGFLLITFFIFTSTMGEPGGMKLVMPKDSKTPMNIKHSGALTIIPGGSGEIFYYEGLFESATVRKSTTGELRNIVTTKKEATTNHDFFVIIKPSANADYGHVVDILDEMTISDVQKYAIADITPQEESIIRL